MKLNDLKMAAAKAQQDLQFAEKDGAELARKSKEAKAKTEQPRLQHKRLKKAAKQAKKLARAAEERRREQRRAWEKAQKRLNKALRSSAKTKTARPGKAAKAAGKGVPPAPVKTQNEEGESESAGN
jgi:hypothetical protein